MFRATCVFILLNKAFTNTIDSQYSPSYRNNNSDNNNNIFLRKLVHQSINSCNYELVISLPTQSSRFSAAHKLSNVPSFLLTWYKGFS